MAIELQEQSPQLERLSSPERIETDVAFAAIVESIERGFQTLSNDDKERLGATDSSNKRPSDSDGENLFGRA